MNEEGIFVDFRIAASYRIPMPVVALRRYSGRDGVYTYPICPRLQHNAAPGIPILLRPLRTTFELEAAGQSDHP